MIILIFAYSYIKKNRQEAKANKIYLKAKKLEENNKNLYDISKLNQALKLYKQCNKLVNKQKFIIAIYQCQKKIDNGKLRIEKYQKETKVNKLYSNAKDLEKENEINPQSIDHLKQALILYEQCNKLINQPKFVEAAERCQQKIDKCQRFSDLVNRGKSLVQQNLFQRALDDFLEAKQLFTIQKLEEEIKTCEVKIKSIENQVNKIYSKAINLERENQQCFCNIEQLNQAQVLYNKCYRFSNKPKFVEAAKRCQYKIYKCQRFSDLVNRGRSLVKQNFYQRALDNFLEAKQLFAIQKLEEEIKTCEVKIKSIKKYEEILKKSKQKAREGKFTEAINLIELGLKEFFREDGQQLLNRLKKIIRAKELYNLGLIAEQTDNLSQAKLNYAKAIHFLPEFTECKIRLSIMLAKKKPKQALFHLEGIKGEQVAYIRGFAYTQLGNWQQANKEWKSINNSVVNSQREIIQKLVKRDRLLKIKEIEDAVNNKNLEIAKDACLEFITNSGSEPTVNQNLEEHIQPLLERQFWASQNWQQIASKTEQMWLDKQDITTLHNYAIATYYQAQIDINNLGKFAIIWLTAIANFKIDPTFKNVTWLGSKTLNLEEVFSQLKQILENTIDTVKDKDIDKYLKLRDIYRRDMVALSLSKQNSHDIRNKQQLLILPGCYLFYRDRFSNITLPTNIYGALYTDWSLAVAACHEGDIARAIKIKPTKNPSSDADRFANCYVSYHEGCYHLQNLEWRKAIKPLQQAKLKILAQYKWRQEIDRLCEIQRQQLENLSEHLQFSKFWYDLIGFPLARSYYVECKARKIAEKLSNETISCEQGLRELRELQKIDRDNYVVLELIKTLEFVEEAEEIKYLMKRGRLEDAVRAAKQSSNENIRFEVAEVCLKILLESAASNSLDVESMHQLGKWAYELCPHEPAFQEIYSSLELYY